MQNGINPVERVQAKQVREYPADKRDNGEECAVVQTERAPEVLVIPAVFQDNNAQKNVKDFVPGFKPDSKFQIIRD